MCRSSGVPTTQGMQGPWALDGDLGPGKNSGTQREPESHSKLGFPAGAGSVTCQRHLEDSPSAHSFEITHSSQDLPWEQRKIHDLGPGPLPPAAASSLHVALHRGAGRRYAFARKHLRFLWISFRNFF